MRNGPCRPISSYDTAYDDCLALRFKCPPKLRRFTRKNEVLSSLTETRALNAKSKILAQTTDRRISRGHSRSPPQRDGMYAY